MISAWVARRFKTLYRSALYAFSWSLISRGISISRVALGPSVPWLWMRA